MGSYRNQYNVEMMDGVRFVAPEFSNPQVSTHPRPYSYTVSDKITRAAAILVTSLLIASCSSSGGSSGMTGGGGTGGGGTGGGGTGGGGFTSWGSAIQPNATVVVPGHSRRATWTIDTNSGQVTSVGNISAFSSGASFTGTYNSSSELTAISLKPAGAPAISWSTANGDTILIIDGVVAAINPAETEIGVAIDPVEPIIDWDYQSFGYWTTGESSGSAGVITVGAITGAGNVPTTGTGTYIGLANGFYVSSDGTGSQTVAGMNAVANFSDRSVSFSTGATTVIFGDASSMSDPSLNLSGTLNYSAGSNQFSGNVTSSGGLSGTADGVFYGPSAQEIGGIFGLTGTGVETFAGGFGGKR